MLCTWADTSRGPPSPTLCLLPTAPFRCGNCSLRSTPCPDCQALCHEWHNTLTLRSSRCPLERSGQSGTCVSEPRQGLMQSKHLPGFLLGLVQGQLWSCGKRAWAQLQRSRDGVRDQSATSCVNPLASLDISEPVPQLKKKRKKKARSTGSTLLGSYPTHVALLPARLERPPLEAETAMFPPQMEPVLFTKTIVHFYIRFYVSLSRTPVYEWELC